MSYPGPYDYTRFRFERLEPWQKADLMARKQRAADIKASLDAQCEAVKARKRAEAAAAADRERRDNAKIQRDRAELRARYEREKLGISPTQLSDEMSLLKKSEEKLVAAAAGPTPSAPVLDVNLAYQNFSGKGTQKIGYSHPNQESGALGMNHVAAEEGSPVHPIVEDRSPHSYRTSKIGRRFSFERMEPWQQDNIVAKKMRQAAIAQSLQQQMDVKNKRKEHEKAARELADRREEERIARDRMQLQQRYAVEHAALHLPPQVPVNAANVKSPSNASAGSLSPPRAQHPRPTPRDYGNETVFYHPHRAQQWLNSRNKISLCARRMQ